MLTPLRFFILLGLAGIILFGIFYWGTSRAVQPEYNHYFAISLIFLILLSQGIYTGMFLLLERMQEFFIQAIFVSVVVKLLLSIIYLFALAYLEPEMAKVNLLSFMGAYTIFLILDIGVIFTRITGQNKTSQSKEIN